MKAIAITGPGASPALVDLPAPSPAEGEVLVRVRGSSVNGFDLSVAHGMLIGMMEHRYPVVLGKDFAGTVEAVGAGVDGFAAGDPVFGVVMKPHLGDGGLGELVTTPAAFLARIPAEVDPAVAGVLGLAGTAAVDAVDAINPSQGETVLVAGATGGVGVIAVQLLRPGEPRSSPPPPPRTSAPWSPASAPTAPSTTAVTSPQWSGASNRTASTPPCTSPVTAAPWRPCCAGAVAWPPRSASAPSRPTATT